MSATIDLMDSSRQCPLIVQEGESLNVTGQLVDFAGDPILKSGLSFFEITLQDEATKAIINSIERQDRLAEVASDGSFTLSSSTATTIPLWMHRWLWRSTSWRCIGVGMMASGNGRGLSWQGGGFRGPRSRKRVATKARRCMRTAN